MSLQSPIHHPLPRFPIPALRFPIPDSRVAGGQGTPCPYKTPSIIPAPRFPIPALRFPIPDSRAAGAINPYSLSISMRI
ncbi:MAG: hypothetical protein IJM66_07885 [Muribaculaceae bacterium]|nr:hypothetical protein [Muribaculaceae bacterium]